MTRPSVLTLIREDLHSQREGFLAQGFWALAVYRLGNRHLAMRRGPLRAICGGMLRLATKWIEMSCGISMPSTAIIGRRLRIEHFGGIIVHGGSVIGDDCLIRHGLTLGNRSEERPDEAPIIGDGVQIGAGAMILGRVCVGDGARIAAGAVVLIDVPAGAVAAGNPARIVRLPSPPIGSSR